MSIRNRIWNQNYDDRYNGNQFSGHRRVSFNPSGAGTGGRQFNNKTENNLNLTTRARRTVPRTDHGQPVARTGYGAPIMRKLVSGTSDWFLVTVPYGQKYEKEYVLKELETLVAPESLIPHYVKVISSALCFYVDDIKIAKILLNGDRRITLPDGFKMIIRVRHHVPQVQIDANLKENIKLAMLKRYTATTKALDLTKFHTDVHLKDIFCALFRPTIMLAAVDVITENIPDLEALDLSDNQIHLLYHLKCLAKKLPRLKILHMANNKITSLNALDALRECLLVDLVLKGNPFKDQLREEIVYISEIRKKFPKLLRLDFVNLPPPMSFDIPEIIVPSPKASNICNYSEADIVRQFLEQYFIIFDSDNRQPLLDAYHQHAMFSLTVSQRSQKGQRLGSYLPHNRNILRIKDFDTRARHLKIGRLPVVSFLSQLPATQHDLNSFAVDLSFFTPKLMLLTVTGIYRERSKPFENICSFQRTFVIELGSGFCIKNEMLHISCPTMAQIKTAFKSSAQPNSAPVPSPAATVATPLTSPLSSTDDATKLQMIQLMSQRSNMNLEWSEKCLTETNWDFDRAIFVFTEFNNQLQVPAEAFAK